MRTDVIERTVNDSMLTIADYLLQMIEQAKKQKDLELRALVDQKSKEILKDKPNLSAEERTEAEYELYYALMKERQLHLFEVKGNLAGTFPVDRISGVQIFQEKNKFYGVYQQEGKDPHRITEYFPNKEALISNLFGSGEFEIFRSRTAFRSNDGNVFLLHDNKQFRLHLIKPFKFQSAYENMEQARLSIVKGELKMDSKLRARAVVKTLNEYDIPTDLSGKTVSITGISMEENGVRVSLEDTEKKRHITLPDLAETWVDRVKEHPRMKAAFDEFIMDSRSVGEGFLSFYGLEINKEIQTKQHDFEVVTDKEGSYIGKLHGTGKVKKVSPSFSSEKEAEVQLDKLKKHIQLEKEKEKQKENPVVEPSFEMHEMVEKN
ncbi:hypothetical protein J7E71_18935 [Mesobacillus foraminis]|uniref:hypothetical protein n=1 Tax=Mesobacillus foraminis TaxID=279826 RepID=UPI001BED3C90|nr:hypothetical protein [Mesobacillus foraminis]MBT2757951.1 hypothetical protein [Mesobacillus foraminis]